MRIGAILGPWVESRGRSAGMKAVEWDHARVWHRYAPPGAAPIFEVVSTRGVRPRLADGRELIDAMSSWWAATHGYGHSAIERAVAEEWRKIPQVMFGGFTHEPAATRSGRRVGRASGYGQSPARLRGTGCVDSAVRETGLRHGALGDFDGRGRNHHQRDLLCAGRSLRSDSGGSWGSGRS